MTNRGFTLIEVLISIILMAVILVGGMAFYTNASSFTTLGSHKKIATYIANTQLEVIRSKGYTNPNLPSSGTSTACSSINPEIIINVGGLPAANSNCTVRVDDISGGTPYKKVAVTFGWTEAGGGPRSVIFTTFLAP